MQLVRALFSTHFSQFGYLQEDTLYPADDPLVVQHPDWFSHDLEPVIHRTGPAAEPKRGPGRPRKIETTDRAPQYEVS